MHQLLLLSLAATAAAVNFTPQGWHSAICTGGAETAHFKCTLHKGDKAGASARGQVINTVFEDGWAKLYVQGYQSKDDGAIARRRGAYGSGFVEGALTAELINNHYKSWVTSVFTKDKPMTDATLQFMLDNWEYTKQLVADNVGSGDVYYARLAEVVLRVEGILAGIEYANANGLTKDHADMDLHKMIILQNTGDLYDIIPATTPSAFRLDPRKLDKEAFREEFHKATSCSCIIKAAHDLSDVFAGHTTFSAYENMLRVFKHWEMRGVDGAIESKVSFPSKPGLVYSKDDFYVLENGPQQMVVLETTNGIMKQELYQKIVPTTLMTWARIPVCNDLARAGQEWTTLMARHNSGTYANQWMVIDMKKFTPGSVPAAGFLNIIEQVPEMQHAGDVTKRFIDNGYYWPSMNVPYFEDIYQASGFATAFDEHGDEYSWENCPRHKVFKRDHYTASSLRGMGQMMRYNQFETDPYAEKDPSHQVAARGDLSSTAPRAWGGIDSKVTSYSQIMSKTAPVALAQNGPTHDDQAPFRWSATNFTNIRIGQPDLFNFGYAEMRSDFDYVF